jgi:hypothetical protein
VFLWPYPEIMRTTYCIGFNAVCPYSRRDEVCKNDWEGGIKAID